MDPSPLTIKETASLCSMEDTYGLPVVPEIHWEVNRGFFRDDDLVWTCYRRNYFAVTCSYSLLPSTNLKNLRFSAVEGTDECVKLGIRSMALTIRAHVYQSPHRPVELEQHTSRQHVGSRTKVPMIVLSPTSPTQNHERSSQEMMAAHMPSPSAESLEPTSSQNSIHTFERLLSRRPTINSGKERARQQYFVLVAELWANHKPDTRESSELDIQNERTHLSYGSVFPSTGRIKVAERRSAQIAV